MDITEIISRYDEHVEYVENIRKCELSFERAKKELPNEFVTHFELNGRYEHWILLNINYVNPLEREMEMPILVLELANIARKPSFHPIEIIKMDFAGVSNVNIKCDTDLKSFAAHCNGVECLFLNKSRKGWQFGCVFLFDLKVSFDFKRLMFSCRKPDSEIK